jgi:hypothetical protein
MNIALTRLLSNASRLHDPAGGTGWAGVCCTETPLDEVAQGLHTDSCVGLLVKLIP